MDTPYLSGFTFGCFVGATVAVLIVRLRAERHTFKNIVDFAYGALRIYMQTIFILVSIALGIWFVRDIILPAVWPAAHTTSVTPPAPG